MKTTRTILICVSFAFLLGAFICSMFMMVCLGPYYFDGSNYTRGSYYNPYHSSIVSLLSASLGLLIISFVFSLFKKKGFYIPSVIINNALLPIVIVSLVFCSISIGLVENTSSAIISTVFCGISIAVAILSIVFGYIVLKKIKVSKTETTNQTKLMEGSLFKISNRKNISIEKAYAELRRIKDLLDLGVLSREDFDNLKKRIIDRID